MKFVAANERVTDAEWIIGEQPRGTITEMQLALGEAGCMAKQSGHGEAPSGRVFQALSEHHVAPAFAVDRPRFGERRNPSRKRPAPLERIGVQFRIAARKPAAIGVPGGGSSASGENGRISAPAFRQASITCG